MHDTNIKIEELKFLESI